MTCETMTDEEQKIAPDPSPILTEEPRVIREVREALSSDGYVQYAEIYRKHSEELRQLAQDHDKAASSAAAYLLRTLLLEQTLPFGELEANPDVDSYTGEPIDLLDERDAEQFIEYGHTPFIVTDPWQEYILTREPYDDPEMNKLFIEANSDGFAEVDDEPSHLEDRGYSPPGFGAEVSTDANLADLWSGFAPFSDDLSKRIDDEIKKRRRPNGHIDVTACRRVVRHSDESKAALRFMQEKLDAGENPANIARLFLRFQHAFCWNWTDAKWLRLVHEPYQCFHDWLEMFEDEILSFADAAPMHTELSLAEITAASDRLMEEYYARLPETPADPRESRSWIRGYIDAVAAGLPIRRTARAIRTALDAAWDAWRRSVSPVAAAAYREAVASGAPYRQANRRFYQVAREEGVTFPAKKAKIKSIKREGLRLHSGRFVNWRVARIKLREGELDLPENDRARLKSLLAMKGWGRSFAAAL